MERMSKAGSTPIVDWGRKIEKKDGVVKSPDARLSH